MAGAPLSPQTVMGQNLEKRTAGRVDPPTGASIGEAALGKAQTQGSVLKAGARRHSNMVDRRGVMKLLQVEVPVCLFSIEVPGKPLPALALRGPHLVCCYYGVTSP